MPAILGWLAGAGMYKIAALVATLSAAGVAFYRYSFEVCLMGAMVGLLFSMFGFRLARTVTLFSFALYVVTQMLGVAVR